MAKFRFQDLKIWQSALDIGIELFDLADMLDSNRISLKAPAHRPKRNLHSF
jgi:hypothetical protein